MSAFAFKQYKTQDVNTASPAQIIVRLYEGAIRFMRQAQGAMAVVPGTPGLTAAQVQQKSERLSRAHAIVTELRAALDRQHSAELCDELDKLYAYVMECISLANASCKAAELEPGIEILETLLESWRTLVSGQQAVPA